MATVRTETYDGKGKLVSSEDVPISDAQVAGDAQNDRLDQALAGLRSYRDAANPTNAQTVTVVKLLCRVAIVLIRRHRGLFDGAD